MGGHIGSTPSFLRSNVIKRIPPDNYFDEKIEY